MGQCEQLGNIEGIGDYRRIDVAHRIRAQPARIWRAITASGEVARWWDRIEIEPREGGKIVAPGETDPGTQNQEVPPLDGTVEVYRPPHIFEFSWNAKTEPAQGVVRFDLTQVANDQTLTRIVYFVQTRHVAIVASTWHLEGHTVNRRQCISTLQPDVS